MKKVYSAKEVAQVIGVSYRVVLELIKNGKIKTLGFSGKARISEYQLDEFLKGAK